MIVLVALIGCGPRAADEVVGSGGSASPSPDPAVDVGLEKLDNVEALRTRFNEDVDKTRIITLLEPG